MLISWTWLTEFVDLSGQTPESLADALTMLGLEVDGIHRAEGGLDNVYVGRVTEVGPHPDADKLRLATVDVGDEGTLTLVCGAPNCEAGMLAPVAVEGAHLPNGMVVKKAKIRGVESRGMLCSAAELGLSNDHSGLLALESGTPGTDIVSYFEENAPENLPNPHEVILELSITPNRGDCLSHLGVARELAAHLGRELREPEPEPQRQEGSEIAVTIEDTAGCPRYAAAVVKNVKVGASPRWLKEAVEAAGARSINNVVDVTNYVAFELGHPQHAFDLSKLSGGTIVVRRARAGESLEAINHEEYELEAEDLVIADDSSPVAIAGVMGGAESEVSEDTNAIVFECAQFDPSSVRRTSKKLGLHSESSHRFERGVDPNGVPRALYRAIELLQKSQDEALDVTQVMDVYPEPVTPDTVALRPERANGLLGLELETAAIRELLEPIGLKCEEMGQSLSVTVPTWRFDLQREVDLVEEVARCHGLDQIEGQLPEGGLGHVHTLRSESVEGMPSVEPTLASWRELSRETSLRKRLQDSGLHECLNYSFIDSRQIEALRFDADDVRRTPVELVNPMSVEQSVMRTSLIPGLLAAVARNQAQQAAGVALYEMGSVFWRSDDAPEEPTMLAFVLYGHRARHWSSEARLWDAHDARGLVDLIADALGHPLSLRSADDELAPWLHPGVRASVNDRGRPIGAFGEVHPGVLEHFGIEDAVFAAELRVDALLGRTPKPVQANALPRFPQSTRDVALLLDAGTPFSEIERIVRRNGPKILESWDIFDVYSGKGIPDGKHSVALSMVYRDPNASDPEEGRTLTDDEVNSAHEALVSSLVSKLKAERR